jgi:hypothetical protein
LKGPAENPAKGPLLRAFFKNPHRRRYLMAKRPVFALVLAILSAFVIFSGPAGAEDWKATLSATWETGKYGTDTRVDTVYIPLTIRRYFDDIGALSLTVPYLDQTSTGQVTFINGSVFQTKGAKKAAVTTESGLGDIIARGDLYVLKESSSNLLDVTLVGKIKFPTADEGKGLGTGRFDEAIGVDLARSIVPDWTGYFDFYYTFIGSPSGLGLKNTIAFDIGAGYKWAEDMTISAFYAQSTPVVSGVDDLRDLLVNVEYKFSKEGSLLGGVDLGLSPSSPDIGITGGVSYRF